MLSKIVVMDFLSYSLMGVISDWLFSQASFLKFYNVCGAFMKTKKKDLKPKKKKIHVESEETVE